jgi:glycosyltransferase involved in cell wall biosynthesis
VIGSAVGGIVDMIEDGVNGMLVAPDDAIALGDAMARLLAEETLRARLGAAAKPAVAAYTAPFVSERFEALYEGAIAASGRA